MPINFYFLRISCLVTSPVGLQSMPSPGLMLVQASFVRSRGVSARMCIPERVFNARVCGTRPPVARWLLNAGFLLFSGLQCLTWCVLSCPPPQMCADRGAKPHRPLPRPCGARCESTNGDETCVHLSLRSRTCTYLHVERPSSCMSMSLMSPYRFVHVSDPKTPASSAPRSTEQAADSQPARPSTCPNGFGAAV